MKLFTKLFFLTIIDFFIIWFWVKSNDPDPSISIALVILIPAVIIINLCIALIFYFTKREYSKVFIINSFIAAFLMYYLFINGIQRRQELRYESWRFVKNDTVFKITHFKLENTFSISENTNLGSSTSFLDGKFSRKDDKFYLITDSTEYRIQNEYLYGFRNSTDSIKLTKIER